MNKDSKRPVFVHPSSFILHPSEEETTVTDPTVQRLRGEVIEPLKGRFVGRDEVIDLIALAVVSGEHLFLYGPPGTAKSALIRQFAAAVRGRYFEYMLTRFSEPNEIFGPIDIGRLREGTVVTVTTGMLPEAEFVFLDELFNANSAILNNLLTVLNERVYRRGAETHRLPLLSLFSASNHLPEDEALRALFDRFLLRCHVKNLRPDAVPQLLRAGWALETAQPPEAEVTSADLTDLGGQLYQADLAGVLEIYTEAVFKVRDLGIAFSDRRAVKVLKLLAASALLCGRRAPDASDLWVLRYVWDREEQIEPLAALVNGLLEQHAGGGPGRHPLARVQAEPDGEDLARQLDAVERQLQDGKLTLSAVARLKERVTDLADRAAWLGDNESRTYLLDRTRKCLEQLG
jgi:MoxR-like ATPase